MPITNIIKLTYTLQAAGLPVSGVDSNGSVSWEIEPTPAQQTEAESIIASFDDTLPLRQFSALTTGPKLIDMVGDPNLYFFPERYRIVVVAASGVVTPPTISMGTNAPNYNNVAPNTALGSVGLQAAADMRNVALTLTRVVLARLPVYANVVVAAVATQFVLRVDFIGNSEPR